MTRPPTNQEIATFIDGLSDLQLAECVWDVLCADPILDDNGRKVMLRLNPRESPTLRLWVFRKFGPSAVPEPARHEDVAADFEV